MPLAPAAPPQSPSLNPHKGEIMILKMGETEGHEKMKECPRHQDNLAKCNCTYEPCERKGLCCECLRYHRASGELPACYFTPEVERTYDRSISRFLKSHT